MNTPLFCPKPCGNRLGLQREGDFVSRLKGRTITVEEAFPYAYRRYQECATVYVRCEECEKEYSIDKLVQRV